MWGSKEEGTHYHSVREDSTSGKFFASSPGSRRLLCSLRLEMRGFQSLACSGKTGGASFLSVSIQIFPQQPSESHYFSIRDTAFRIGDQLWLSIQPPLQFCHPYDSILCLIFCPFYSPGAREQGFEEPPYHFPQWLYHFTFPQCTRTPTYSHPKRELSYIVSGNCKSVQPLWKTVQSLLKKKTKRRVAM